ncbi:hypothetical protein AB0D27_14195 [Streptomyces sp. NPDC048415]|uniref:hypothetical protein n=1 Tax=Streptomyces sp. NPDC048415 TaxID=3154822 RepID=UPI00342C1208
MSGSTKRRRRRQRAAGPSLGYDHAPGRKAAAPERRWKRARALGFACLVLLIGVGVVSALVVGPLAWAGDLWHEVAPGWPGGGYGFAVSAGLLFPASLLLFGAPLTRVKWKTDKVRSLPWAGLSLPGAALAVIISAVAMQTWHPKRSHRYGLCSSVGEYCWISGRYPYVSLVGLAATVVGTALLITAYGLYDKRRRAAEPAATRPSTSEPPDPPRPSCPSRT